MNNLFNSEKEAIKWVKEVTPFAIKPKREAKTTFINPFTSVNAFEVITDIIGEEIYKRQEKLKIEIPKNEFIMPKCMKCFDKGYYTIGGSFGGGATEIQCNCKCEHPIDSRIDYHDNSILCTKCNKVIAQNGIFL